MEQISNLLYDYLVSIGLTGQTAIYTNLLALLIITLGFLFSIDFIVRKIIIKAFNVLSLKSKTKFDDLLVANKTPRNIAHIIPLIIALELTPFIFKDFSTIENLVEKGLQIFGIILVLWIVRSVLNTLKDYFKTLPQLRDKPIDSYIQVFMIFAWFTGFVFAFAILTGISIWSFFTALGAISAVLILVFKDTILGFVASIQVSINDMVRIGDWITFEKYGADGDVIEINLSTVKVQNFDKTITTIPTYALISDSFKNWRGMTNSDGRRIKRAVLIKQESIKFLSQNDVEKLLKIDLIANYIKNIQDDITTHNQEHNINKELSLNGRNLTNVGVFRKYIEEYAKNHSAINKDMMIMARQLAPTSQGLPIEIYAFSKDKRWENYEYIMADIFDHLLAAVTVFDLELFELPSSSNFKA
jgi:miniconductance mechanosensitive channel